LPNGRTLLYSGRINMRSGVRFLVVALFCAGVGCGGEAGLKGLVAASGTVTYKGAPVEGATVAFVPDGDGKAAGGRTDASGKFTLTTVNPGDGVLPGRYKVSVTKMVNLDTAAQVTAEDMAKMVAGGKAPPMGPTKGKPGDSGGVRYDVPKKYSNPIESGLTAEVKASGTNDFTFELVD
jgi:hypothetical protein